MGSATSQRLHGWHVKDVRPDHISRPAAYQNAWNFQNRNGSLHGQLRQANLHGTMQTTGPTGSTTFAGSFNSTRTYQLRRLNGAFFSVADRCCGHQAGTFSIPGM